MCEELHPLFKRVKVASISADLRLGNDNGYNNYARPEAGGSVGS